MQLLRILAVTLPFFIIFSCRQKEFTPKADKLITATVQKFPELIYPKLLLVDYYSPVRSLTIEKSGVKLELWSTPKGDIPHQSIIFVTNKNKERYCIPLLDNMYWSYWNYPDGSLFKSIRPTNSSFEKELQNCIDTLGLNDTLGTAVNMIHEMFVSLLQCRVVADSDSSGILGTLSYPNYGLPEENTDSCHSRAKRNWNAIYKSLHPSEYTLAYNCFWDEKNARVYQLIWNMKWKEKLKFKIQTYRQDCIFHYQDL